MPNYLTLYILTCASTCTYNHISYTVPPVLPLPQLNAKLSDKFLPNLLVQSVRLFGSKSLLQTAVSDAVAETWGA
jgi:hypothetical protein